ncbi:lytic transglycosylase domain-containing protein [Nocardioides sp. SYSU D00038]|uniref:lytic transglycosylase domain-containing protein n=1 Tax=Nocardioides sp. SYSU D00038 TaxID=2812554 RepID=UPI001967BCC4|nr:lytic murein transglycosylase [Nocardioides sp. SYSU D00038]
MTTQRFGRLQKATALVPLALLSAAWTANLAGVGGAAVATETPKPTLPDGTSVPSQAIEAPASVSTGEEGLGGADVTQIVSTSSTSGIPSAALAAYQRAETVINAADKTCNVSWQLVAAIGRVESNHGRANSNTLDSEGVATPGIYGIALDGSNNTAVITDTDAGQYDNDTTYDRAVGPMQFIPSTWSVVGVDADGDGQRNPQDIDDAALGTAVYLCSGDDDLSTTPGQRTAVYRYNHSNSYVSLVLSIMDAYSSGDFTSIPTSTAAAGYLVPESEPTGGGSGSGGGGESTIKNNGGKGNNGGTGTVDPSSPTQPGSGSGGDDGGSNGGDSGGDGGDGGDDGGNGGGRPTLPLPSVSLPPLPSTSIKPVDDVLTLTQAILQCTLDGLNELLQPQKFQQCVKNYTT